MKWAFRIGRIWGIEVFIHYLFVAFMAFVFFQYALNYNILIAIKAVSLLVIIFFCVLLHEFGHSLTALYYKIPVRSIVLTPIGGIASIEFLPLNSDIELKITIAGPLVNFIIALFLLPIAIMAQYMFRNDFLLYIMSANVILMLFNMIPAFPMDGGRVLRALLAKKFNLLKATHIAVQVGTVCAIVMAIIGAFYNVFLVFIAVFVIVAGKHEQKLIYQAIHGHMPEQTSTFGNFSNPRDMVNQFKNKCRNFFFHR